MAHSVPRRLAFAGAALIAFAGCERSANLPGKPPPPAAGGVQSLRLSVRHSPASLNPFLMRTLDEASLANLVYDPLVAPDRANHLQPRLARVVPTVANGGIARDGKTITFKLRTGVRWHDGRPFTSADVAFTFSALNDSRVNVAQRTGFDRIARITTPDAQTVVLSLREPFAPFVAYCGYAYPIVPKHLFTGGDVNRNPSGGRPVGTGPYRFVRWKRGNRIDYVANERYFLGAPHITHLTVAEIPDQGSIAIGLRTQRLDFAVVESATYAQLRRTAGVRTAAEPMNDWVGYALNTTRPILRDVRVRRALSMTIDRAGITAKSTLGTGIVAYADLPALMWTPREPVNPYGYDPKAAGALLDAAGWRRAANGMRQKNGRPLQLNLIDYSGSPTGASEDLQVQQLLRDAGITLTPKYYSLALYYENKKNGGPLAAGDFDLAAFAWSGGIDPKNDTLYVCANREPNGYNVAAYCSARMDELQRDSLATLDPARRAIDIAAIERLAVTDVPYLFLYHAQRKLAWNARLVRTHSSTVDPWSDIRTWTYKR